MVNSKLQSFEIKSHLDKIDVNTPFELTFKIIAWMKLDFKVFGYNPSAPILSDYLCVDRPGRSNELKNLVR